MQTLQLLLVVVVQRIEGRRKNMHRKIDLMNKVHFILNKFLALSATSSSVTPTSTVTLLSTDQSQEIQPWLANFMFHLED